VSFKFDVYSLGAIIMELVTGRRGNPDINNVRITQLTFQACLATLLSFEILAYSRTGPSDLV
jgi:hypothetical protein